MSSMRMRGRDDGRGDAPLIRHPALQDLSRDHHAMLLHAQRLLAASDRTPQDALNASRSFLQFWSGALLDHVEEEQFHAVEAATETAIQGRYNQIHEILRAQVDQLRITLMDPQFFRQTVRSVAQALKSHVSFCEATLFFDLQTNVPEPQLKKLGETMTAYRRKRRPQSIGPNATENCYLG